MRYYFNAIDALPATGKTHSSIANHIKENSDKTLLMVMPHIKTLKEKVQLAYNLRAQEDSPFKKYNKEIKAVHSENTVGNITLPILEALKDNSTGILFITHEGFLQASKDITHLAQSKQIITDVFIDEELSAVKDIDIPVKLFRWKNELLPYFTVNDIEPKQLDYIDDESSSKDKDSILHITLKEDYKSDGAVSKELKDFFKVLANPNYKMYINKLKYLEVIADLNSGADENSTHSLIATAVLDPETYAPLQPTFMAAFFKDTIFYQVMMHMTEYPDTKDGIIRTVQEEIFSVTIF